MNQAQAHVHKYVADHAKGLAHEVYDALMRDDRLFAAWKKQNPGATGKALESRFVAKNWAKCIAASRAMLAAMLAGPYDEVLKETIYQALILDNTLVRGRRQQN